jgi:hypothetical protein
MAVGVRTASGPSWGSGVSLALRRVIVRPSLWLWGAVGFLARGGVAVLALPIITIPSPVILSILLGDQFDATGLAITGEVALWATALALALVLIGVLLAAYADATAFGQQVAQPQTGAFGADGQAPAVHRGGSGGIVLVLAVLQVLALLPILAAALVLAGPVYDIALQERALPSSATTPLAIRVLLGARDPLALLLVALVLADVVYATSSRAVLAWHAGVTSAPGGTAASIALRGALRPLSRPARTIATALVSWAVTLLVVAPVVWAIVVAWQGVRKTLLSPAALTDPQQLPSTLAAIVIFAAIWVAGLVLAGFASAVRAALWSVDTIR